MAALRRLLPLLALALPACTFSATDGVRPPGPDAGDTQPDVAIEPPVDARVCFGAFEVVCLRSAPVAPLVIDADTTIDTSASQLCAATTSGPDACVLAGTTVTVAAKLRATGPRPLVILATTGAITVSGTIDVASHRQSSGAGANPSACVAPADPQGGGGGAGGSFAGRGGAGGTGGDNDGVGGRASATVSLAALRGGCRGGAGAGADKGAGGAGGGAVDLIAASIAVQATAVIDASGAGGRGGARNQSGGGGGGSGGAIVFDASDVTIAAGARVLAQGGAGGEGSGVQNAGNDGDDPAMPGTAALGGTTGSSIGGDGGNGSTAGDGDGGSNGVASDVDITTGSGGGGAGGGGAGFVRSLDRTPTGGAAVSPAISFPPS